MYEMYEYDVKVCTALVSKEQLDDLGKEGWELAAFNLVPSDAVPNSLVNGNPYVWLYYFKRERQPQ